MKWTARTILFIFLLIALIQRHALAQDDYARDLEAAVSNEYYNPASPHTIFDDQMLLNGYTKKYSSLSKEILLEMIKDDTLTPYRSAAAIKVFKEKFSGEVVSPERKSIEKILLRRLHRTDSPFIQIEIMHTLCLMDRFSYFKSMVPALIQKLDHYNAAVNEIAFANLNQLVEAGSSRPREARIVFNTLRKILFLSRKRLGAMKELDPKLARKLKLLRWSIKALGNQELKKLPKEVINLL